MASHATDTGASPVRAWLPAQLLDLGVAMPDGVLADAYPMRGPWPGDIDDVEFLVPRYLDRHRILDALPLLRRLHVIQTISAGVEWIVDRKAAGVVLCNAQGVHDGPVAEWVLAAILSMFKKLPDAMLNAVVGRWGGIVPDELAGSTVLLLGYGSIAAAVETRLLPFGPKIIRVARHPRPGVMAADRLDDLLPRADVVVVLVPATADTVGMVDARFLRRMKVGALLVNPARGAVVDTGALMSAANAGKVRAMLDVTDPEPLPSVHPLWTTPGVVVTPHIAGDVPAFAGRAMALVVAQLARYRAGEPLINVVKS